MNTKCSWIVENFADNNSCEGLRDSVVASGRECQYLRSAGAISVQLGGYKGGEKVVVHGTINLAQKCQSELISGAELVVFLNATAFACSRYYPVLREHLFNDRHELIPLSLLKQNRFEYYARYGREAVVFVRPDSGIKTFTGQLLDLQDFDRFWSNSASCMATDEDLVVVSTPKTIRGEWRYVVVDGKISAKSLYQYQGQSTCVPHAPLKADRKVEEIIAAGYRTDPVYCVDVCEDADGKMWLMELTSFSSAGLYACDKYAVVKAVSEYVEM